MSVFAGDYIKYNWKDSLNKRDKEQICARVKVLEHELTKARVDAYEQIINIFSKYPNRKYRYHWPEYDEWESDMIAECPLISYQVNDRKLTIDGTIIETKEFVAVYVENREIMVKLHRQLIPLVDVIQVERVLEELLSAKDYNQGMLKNGFYYEDN